MKSESEALFVKQLKENQNIIHKICRLYTTDIDAHKDLFQEITIQLWKAFPNFRGDSKFTTWAYRVGLNTAITLYRKKKRTIDTIEFDSTFHRVTQEEYNFEEEEKLKKEQEEEIQNENLTRPLRRGNYSVHVRLYFFLFLYFKNLNHNFLDFSRKFNEPQKSWVIK